MNLITEALLIAKDNFDFDGEYEKSKLIAELLKEVGE